MGCGASVGTLHLPGGVVPSSTSHLKSVGHPTSEVQPLQAPALSSQRKKVKGLMISVDASSAALPGDADEYTAQTPPPNTPPPPEAKAEVKKSEGQLFDEYMQRQRERQKELKACMLTRKERHVIPLRSDVHYINPFLSSTFRDFNDERNLMGKVAFPELEKLCNQRGVYFAPKDLRWGVTSEQSSGGHVIKICLEEIDRSVPFFVGSLGFRNGWALSKDYHDDLLEKTFEIAEGVFPWVKERRDRSVTEIEMLHGALNDPDKCCRSYFYMRSVEYLEKLPADQRKIYCDIGEPAESKLHDLKKRIIMAGFPVKWFDTPEEMVDALKDDMIQMINVDFPLEHVASPLDIELRDHRTFADMRTHVFVSRPAEFAVLDDFVFGSRQSAPLWISGPSGIGKTALMANWIDSIETRAAARELPNNDWNWNNCIVIARFIGATRASTSSATLLHYILSELKEAVKYDHEVPRDVEKLKEEFPSWLENITADSGRPIILVLDSLSSLVETDLTLSWLPYVFGPGIKVIVTSSTDSDCVKFLRERVQQQNWLDRDLDVLSEEQCGKLLEAFMSGYGKSFDGQQTQTVLTVEHGATRNPLYLLTFLQEMRAFGIYEQVNARIQYYLAAHNLTQLYSKVIERLEEDFNPSNPGLVEYVLCAIGAARQGLGEPELKGTIMGELGYTEETWPSLEFSALMLRMNQYLNNQRGLRNFANKQMSEAVESRYALNEKALRSHHLLANYFEEQPVGPRRVEELPHHLWFIARASTGIKNMPSPPPRNMTMRSTTLGAHTAAHAAHERNMSKFVDAKGQDVTEVLERLEHCLTDLEMFTLFKDKFDLHRYWRLLEKRTEDDTLLMMAYTEALGNAHQKLSNLEYAELCEGIASFLIDTSRYQYETDEQPFLTGLLHQAIERRQLEHGEDNPALEKIITMQAELYTKLGRYEDARASYEQALGLLDKHLEALPRSSQEARAIRLRIAVVKTGKAELLQKSGDYKAAEDVYTETLKEKISLSRRPESDIEVAFSQASLGTLYLAMSRYDKALDKLQQALHVAETARSANHPHVAAILSSIGAAYVSMQQYEKAIEVLLRSKAIKEAVFGPGHMGVAVLLGNYGTCLAKMGREAEARKHLRAALTIIEDAAGDMSPSLVATLMALSEVYQKQDLYTALTYSERALRIVEHTHGARHQKTIAIYRNMSESAELHGENDAALGSALKALEIAEEVYVDSPEESLELAEVLERAALLRLARKEKDEALKLTRRSIQLAEKSDSPKRLAHSLFQAGCWLLDAGDVEEAKASLERCLEVQTRHMSEDQSAIQETKEWLEACEDLAEDDEELLGSAADLAGVGSAAASAANITNASASAENIAAADAPIGSVENLAAEDLKAADAVGSSANDIRGSGSLYSAGKAMAGSRSAERLSARASANDITADSTNDLTAGSADNVTAGSMSTDDVTGEALAVGSANDLPAGSRDSMASGAAQGVTTATMSAEDLSGSVKDLTQSIDLAGSAERLGGQEQKISMGHLDEVLNKERTVEDDLLVESIKSHSSAS